MKRSNFYVGDLVWVTWHGLSEIVGIEVVNDTLLFHIQAQDSKNVYQVFGHNIEHTRL